MFNPDDLFSLRDCPECGFPAEVLDFYVLGSTDGPVQHWRTRCVQGHVLTSYDLSRG